MELSQLRSFLQVAEEGGVTRAAETLCLTQPAVTQQIQALERELGTLLFDRTGRGVRLTAAGAALVEHARQSLAILDEVRGVIADLETGVTGRLVIGAGVTTSIFQLPSPLRAYREAYPGVDVAVTTGRSREVTAMVLGREVDLGLVTTTVEDPSLTAMELYEEEIALVAPAGHVRAMGLDALSAAPMILFPKGAGFRDYLDRVLAEVGISANVKMETDSVEAIKSFVAVGLGVSFLPMPAVDAELRSGALSMVSVDGLPKLTRRTSVVYRKDRYLSAAARAFLAVLTGCREGS